MAFEAREVSVRLGDRQILDRVSLDVMPGKLTVIAGPNGAGKSTLLKLLTGELAPSSGAVVCDGVELSRLGARMLAQRRSVLPQSSGLAFPFTALEVVMLGLESRFGLSAAQRRAEAAGALAQVDLAGFAARRYQELSGGEQQRVHLARALCQVGAPMRESDPCYLFLDEPTSSLDIRHQIQTLRIARDFAGGGGGVLAILHDLNLAVAFADHLVVLRDGRVHAAGAPHDVVSDALLRDVFHLDMSVRHVPRGNQPFVLPHGLAET
jgi:iron complex transport system ATP-binding protein